MPAVLRLIAQRLAYRQGGLSGYDRRPRAKGGAPEAVTATAHQLARIVFAMRKNTTEDFTRS
jgi:transposase